jgi:hypothetical protein
MDSPSSKVFFDTGNLGSMGPKVSHGSGKATGPCVLLKKLPVYSQEQLWWFARGITRVMKSLLMWLRVCV